MKSNPTNCRRSVCLSRQHQNSINRLFILICLYIEQIKLRDEFFNFDFFSTEPIAT